MSPRTRRTAASFAVVFVAYWIYRLAVNPFIDPSIEWRSPTLVAASPSTAAPDDRLSDFQKMFPPDAWERQDPIVLEADGAKLLMKDYENLPDGRVRLSKCTMVFVPEGEPSPTRSNRIIVLQSPEGAMLQFDTPIDLARGKVGRLIGGQLLGLVTIYGTPSRPDAQDELQVLTRDVRLEEQQLWTDQLVEFRYGPNHGRGRELRIDLLPGVNVAKRRGPNVGGVERLQLMHDVQMHLKPTSAGLLPGDGDRNVTLGARVDSSSALAEPVAHNSILDPQSSILPRPVANEPPLDIRCQGPFKFDLVNQVASFEDRVDVNRSLPTGVSDQLRCELLRIFFAPRASSTIPTALSGHASAGTRRPGAMEPRRLEATGNPVTVTAPSSGASARGNRLEYDIRTRRITLEADRDQPEVTLVQLGSEFRGRKIMFERPVVGGLPNAQVDGAGWFRMVPPDDPRSTVEARWTKQLTLQPADGSHRLSLLGQAHTNFTQFGNLAADEIHLWLRQNAAPAAGSGDRGAGIGDAGATLNFASDNGIPRHTALRPGVDAGANEPLRNSADSPRNPTATRMRAVPQRMLALRSVRFNSPQLNGSAEQLEVWFDANGTPLLNNPVNGGNGSGPTRPGSIRPLNTDSGTSARDPMSRTMNGVASGSSTNRLPNADTAPRASGDRAIGSHTTGPLPRQRFELAGRLIRVQLITLGTQTQVDDVTVEGAVRFVETQIAVDVGADSHRRPSAGRGQESPPTTTAQRPMSMTGDRLQVLRASSPDTSVTLIGKPAQVSARGMDMIGDRIRLERGENLLWIEGAGRMNLPANANAQSAIARPAAAPQGPAANGLLPMAGMQSVPLTIDFQGGMNFDGLTARYKDGVVVNSESRTVRAAASSSSVAGIANVSTNRPAIVRTETRVMKTEQLEVRLKQRVDFAAAGDPQRSEVDRLDCVGGVELENRTSDQRGVIAVDQINTRDLAIQQTSGAIRAQGPGWVRSIRLGTAGGAMSMPGIGAPRPPVSNVALQPGSPASPPPNAEQINYLHVDFQRELTGNLHRRELVLHEDVRCVYGPIETWTDRLDVDRPDKNGPRAATVGCDQLVVTQMPAPAANGADAYANEIQAIGNTLVEGQQFLARAHRLSYVEGKEQLVLEGDGRSDAELYYQQATGGTRTEARAGKITYWPSTGRYDVDKARFINLGQMGPSGGGSDERGARSER